MAKLRPQLVLSAALAAISLLLVLAHQPSRHRRRRRRPDAYLFSKPHTLTFANARRPRLRRLRRPSPTPTGAGSSGGSIGDLGQPALQPDDHQPRARHGAARRQRADQLQRLRQRVRLGGIVLGRHSRPQGAHAQSVAAGRHRLHPVQRGRLQRHQRADRRVRAALRFHRLGIVAAVLRRRHHPDAVREGALSPQLHDEPRRGDRSTARPTAANYGVYGRAGWISRLSPRDEVAASVEVWQLWQRVERLYGPGRRPSIRSTPRSRPAPTGPASSRSADSGRICSAAASRATSTADGCSPSRTHSGIVATVTGDGTVVPTIGNQGWFEYGGRLGFRITKGWVADLFVNGTAGPAAGRQHHPRRRRIARELLAQPVPRPYGAYAADLPS